MRIASARVPRAALACLMLILAFPTTLARGQDEPGAWSEPVSLFETTGRASEPEVVADPAGTVHVFWAYGDPEQEDGSGQALYYARKRDGTWSQPVDVLLSPGGNTARMPSVVADASGYLHIVWSGGGAIYYSRAYAPEAHRVSAWSQPVALTSAVTALEPAVAVDHTGKLYVVWTQAKAGLMLARSLDAGESWTNPQVIFSAPTDQELARWGRIALDDLGRLHLVLTHVAPPEEEGDRNPHFLYYLRSDDQGDSWTDPFEVVAEPDFGEMSVAAFGEGEIHLAWNGRAGRRGRYHRWSSDGGKTWGAVIEVAAPEDRAGAAGLTGFPVVLADAAGSKYMILNGGKMYSTSWLDGTWSNPVLISGDVDGCGVTGENCQMEDFSAAISGGNQLHAVFHDGLERIWYATRQVDAPGEAPRPLPTATPTVVATDLAAPTVTPKGLATPIANQVGEGPAPLRTGSPLVPLGLGGVSALVVLGIAILLRQTGPWGRR